MSELLERMRERTNEMLMEIVRKQGRHTDVDAFKLARDVTLEVVAEELDKLEIAK